jgi:hypothetical protein
VPTGSIHQETARFPSSGNVRPAPGMYPY